MTKKEEAGLKDEIILVCRRKDGSIKWRNESLEGNSISKYGMAQVAGLILTDIGGAGFDFVGIGDSGAAESVDHSDLQAAANKVRKAGTGTQITTTQTNDTAQLFASFSSADGPSGTWSVQEAGVFTLVSAGVMLFRKIFTAKSVDWATGDTLDVTAKCQVKQGS